MELPADLFLEISEGARFEREATDVRRKAPRVLIALDAVVVRLGTNADTKPMAVVIRDISAVGARLDCQAEFHVRDAFAMRFLRRDGTPIWIQCEVTRWIPQGEKLFSIGAKFLKIVQTGKPQDAAANAA